ncbi:MAG TPA: prepilin-type N-terminal cleavage/methylation domain-containing protein, partial [Pyrinomonadaceae bacterium]|nr:prepilin-type N-terminal cleavage/methylation domain-containing protein [Pyrinomonadaceae bacterium]
MIQQLTIDSPRRNSERGFSVIEILIVVAIITIMSAVAIPYVYSYRKLYKSEEQSLKVIDLMREANQMALNRRRTIRLELDMTRNAILLIDEGSVPAKLVKAIPLEQPGTLRMDVAPAGITIPDPPKYDTAVFANDAIGHMDGSGIVMPAGATSMRSVPGCSKGIAFTS